MSCFRIVLSSIFIFLAASCQKTFASDLSNKAIIGKNDWIVFNQTGDNLQDTSENTVALLNIPAINSTCTGFLINADTIMTNNHCIRSSSQALNVSAMFRDNSGIKTTYNCSQFITTDLTLDFTLVKCSSSPGLKFGWVGLSKMRPQKRSRIYIIQENCDYISDPHCIINKYVSFGEVFESQLSRVYHDADTLGGSSGSPIFSEDTHQVIAIHNGAAPENSLKVEMNSGVPMFQIQKKIQTTTSLKIYEFGSVGNLGKN